MIPDRLCKVCGKAEREATSKFTKCRKCSRTFYCSCRCKKLNHKPHKKICGKQQEGDDDAPSGRDTVLIVPTVTNPFTRLDNGTWLHDRPFLDVFTLLIDAYRLRMGELYKMGGLHGFKRFLDLVEKKPGGLLPPWWDPAMRDNCCKFGLRPPKHKKLSEFEAAHGQWSDLVRTIREEDVVKHYADPTFPDQLRIFAYEVYASKLGLRQLDLEYGDRDWPEFKAHMARREKPGGIRDGYHDDKALLASELQKYKENNDCTGPRYLPQ
ncbi:hypothetical protein CkaCkLH20_06853 [Colletotrichum karsti]|uniref:MYND-type domain-containing protein n=1 Tax=Colletotrichum karsti TaxID=1095194 RepID=A0A9P6I1Y4_9PEZI|nr:uncharacterized protein CkaCkLH20_06853 [Colletotrichum karsti]KAF9875472.1 hypothetical protein CkaCkLH20_06853 [Colletotrichum karsti]